MDDKKLLKLLLLANPDPLVRVNISGKIAPGVRMRGEGGIPLSQYLDYLRNASASMRGQGTITVGGQKFAKVEPRGGWTRQSFPNTTSIVSLLRALPATGTVTYGYVANDGGHYTALSEDVAMSGIMVIRQPAVVGYTFFHVNRTQDPTRGPFESLDLLSNMFSQLSTGRRNYNIIVTLDGLYVWRLQDATLVSHAGILWQGSRTAEERREALYRRIFPVALTTATRQTANAINQALQGIRTRPDFVAQAVAVLDRHGLEGVFVPFR